MLSFILYSLFKLLPYILSSIFFYLVKHEFEFAFNREKLIKELDGRLLTSYSKTIEIRGKRLRVVDIPSQKKKDAPLLVFIHGLGSQVSIWRYQLEEFYNEFNLLAIDLVGHGNSEVTKDEKDYSLDSISKDVIEILTLYQKQHQNNIILIGHSFVILISPVLGIHTAPWIIQYPWYLLSILRTLDRFGGIYSKSVNRVIHPEYSTDKLKLRQLKWNYLSYSKVVQSLLKQNQYKMKLQEFNSKYENKEVLIINGLSDRVTDIFKLNTKLTMILYEHCGHNPMIENTTKLNIDLEGFFKNK
ncbi:alpha/beta-hydrolase [Neoconidiobolus thromboides FSU 785]|nr:alpha/beta-hydrolase [Neoconidiobolus thromboides FSU 785]